jgi:integrase/recombinase XerD
MSALAEHTHNYLQVRRALGFKLVGEGQLLREFVACAETAGQRTITTQFALQWARRPASASRNYLSRRLRAVRGFARYLHALDPTCEVPPIELLPASKHRPAPYLYRDDEILAMMAAAGGLRPPLRAATFQTLIGLLACTGLRIGEAIRLDREDFDSTHGLLIVRDSKFGKSREVLLHESAARALVDYGERRGRLCPDAKERSFFITTRGTRLCHPTVYVPFRALLDQAGIRHQSPSRRVRIHDLRHSFAVKTLLGWYRDGDDVAARMPLLSTYLGHVDPAATYWYLSAAPELLALAAERLEQAAGGRR